MAAGPPSNGQMSGRAGRRGLDDKGIVILMLDSKLEPAIAKARQAAKHHLTISDDAAGVLPALLQCRSLLLMPRPQLFSAACPLPLWQDMVKGAPDTLYSEFHLGYSMLLNLLRVEGANPEALMRASYRQFQVRVHMQARLPTDTCSYFVSMVQQFH